MEKSRVNLVQERMEKGKKDFNDADPVIGYYDTFI